MTSFERYLAVLNGLVPDILPRTPILMQFAAEYIGADYAAFASDYRVLVDANLRCAQDFGFDQLSSISDPYRETQGFGGVVEYRSDGPPTCTHPLEADRSLDILHKPDPEHSERMADRLSAIREYRKRVGDTYSVLGWVEGPAAEAADLRGVTNLLIDLIDDCEYASKLMMRCVDAGIEFARAQIEAGADTIGIGDAIASQVGSDVYERLIAPGEKRLVDAIHDSGAYVKLHICGNITHLLPAIAELGVDILDVDYMVSLEDARSAVGGGVTLAGNIDPVSGIQRSDPDSIALGVKRCYELAGPPFMINAGCEIPSATPYRNLEALCYPRQPYVTTSDTVL